ncbi:hypothetical protein [Allokutzneria sp. NRRL B-24872]|nr:hypothetical protein [Allokutzneria sp. NRRL B-24872]
MRSVKLFAAAVAVSGLATGLLITPAQAAAGGYERCPATTCACSVA